MDLFPILVTNIKMFLFNHAECVTNIQVVFPESREHVLNVRAPLAKSNRKL
jgi:hypothetical protein